jgi:transcriptional regulator with XRE-family HTH domain
LSAAVHQAKEALGNRLRELRKDAGLTGRQFAMLAGWPGSKVSKIEYGNQAPTEGDIRAWCRLTAADGQVLDLIASVRDIEIMYVEWRRKLRTGTKRRQEASITIEADTKLFRWFEPALIPGIFHTSEYAAAVMKQVIDFFEIPDDLDAGVSARMERQQILYRGDRQMHVIIGEQALRTEVGSPEVMIGQLDRLLAVSSLSRVRLGIIPERAPYRVPSGQFIMFDDRMVHVEAISAELTITQPREISLYAKAFEGLTALAVNGRDARSLITAELRHLTAAR